VRRRFYEPRRSGRGAHRQRGSGRASTRSTRSRRTSVAAALTRNGWCARRGAASFSTSWNPGCAASCK
jgi:hypothetical protein